MPIGIIQILVVVVLHDFFNEVIKFEIRVRLIQLSSDTSIPHNTACESPSLISQAMRLSCLRL